MHKASLIVATLGERPDDLRVLLQSLAPQVEFISEVIIVDQNFDHDRIPDLLCEFRGALPVRYTRSERGLSRARNHGLTLVTGDIVAFPDDDCVYSDGLLEWVINWFASNIEYDILAVGVKDAAGVPSGNRWSQPSCEIRSLNAFRTTFSSSLFLCADLAKSARFDVQLGVGSGTPFGSGEETDYVLRLLRTPARGRFDRTRYVIHPRRDMLSGSASAARAQAYGFGMGHVLHRNSFGSLWMSFIAYNLGRAAFVLSRGNLKSAQLCIAQTKGLWHGFLTPVPAPAPTHPELRIVPHRVIAAATEPQLAKLRHSRSGPQPDRPQLTALDSTGFRATDELTKTYVGNSLN
jgi:hypothetical protein